MSIDLTKKLSPNFALGEMLVTDHREFLEQQQNPSQEIVDNLEALCEHILQPLRDMMPDIPLHVNSGYRCKDLNITIGGAANSQHMTGEAADIIDFKEGNLVLFERIKNSDLPFDQLIQECPDSKGIPAWVHVSFDPNRTRRMVLEAEEVGKNPNGSPKFGYKLVS